MDIGMQRYFQIPGQDLVWRYVTPGETALHGEHSTMAKCASSAMIHLGRRRNSNELYGAYGHELTFAEVKWLANWCFARGQNLLYPHAFYYSVRGPRRDERPPDVGPNSAWWDDYRPYADACRRLCWINTDSQHVCSIAILGDSQWLPDAPAKVCYQHQRDFNYLEVRHLVEDARVAADGVHLAGMHYRAVVMDQALPLREALRPALQQLAAAGRLVAYGYPRDASPLADATVASSDAELLSALDALTDRDVVLDPPVSDVRVRHVVKNGRHFYLLFNEGLRPFSVKVEVSSPGLRQWWDPQTGRITASSPAEMVNFAPGEMKLMSVASRP
jgi:hypothetical protein